MLAFTYPGQGAQRVGMARSLLRDVRGRAVFRDVSDRVGVDLARLCLRGPERDLTATANAQPAMFAAGVAAHLALGDAGVSPGVVAGHSVGELVAAWAAGALSFDVAADLVVERGRLMAAIPGDGAMAAVHGIGLDEVRSRCDGLGVELALENSPVDAVVSGPRAAVAAATETFRRAGARQVTVLRTSHAFHSRQMAGALDAWRQAVSVVPAAAPAIPFVTNVDAAVASTAADVRDALVRQLVSPVRWWQTVVALEQLGVDAVVEAGDTRGLSALARRAGTELLVLGMAAALRAAPAPGLAAGRPA